MRIEEAIAEIRKNAYKCPIIRKKSWKSGNAISFEISHQAALQNVLNCELFDDDWEVIYENS